MVTLRQVIVKASASLGVLVIAGGLTLLGDRFAQAETPRTLQASNQATPQFPMVSPALIADKTIEELSSYRGSVSIIYNLKESGIDVKLSAKTLAEIFEGKFTNWQQINVRYPQEEIRVVALSEKSLSNLIFTRYLNFITHGDVEASWQPSWNSAFLYAKTPKEGEIASIVDQTPGAIAYIPSVIAEYYDMPTVQIKDTDGQYIDRIH